MATSTDDNAADEQSDKSRCQLFNICCTSTTIVALMCHLLISYTFCLPEFSSIALLLVNDAYASMPSNTMYKAISDFAKSVCNQ